MQQLVTSPANDTGASGARSKVAARGRTEHTQASPALARSSAALAVDSQVNPSRPKWP
jgi:hypothetical protein